MILIKTYLNLKEIYSNKELEKNSDLSNRLMIRTEIVIYQQIDHIQFL